jgi:hypothetical protein
LQQFGCKNAVFWGRSRSYFSNTPAGIPHELRTPGALKDLALSKELSKDRFLAGMEEMKGLPGLPISASPVAGFKGKVEETIANCP